MATETRSMNERLAAAGVKTENTWHYGPSCVRGRRVGPYKFLKYRFKQIPRPEFVENCPAACLEAFGLTI